MVKDAILIPVMLDYLQDDLNKAKSVGFKLDLVLTISLKNVLDRILSEHRLLKTSLREHGIQIYNERRTSTAIEAQYKCRGYHHTFSLLWDVVRTEIQLKASQIIKIKITDG